MGVYAELRGFAIVHRQGDGPRHANTGSMTEAGYRLFVICGCGAEFKRWMNPDEASDDLVRSTLLAFEN